MQFCWLFERMVSKDFFLKEHIHLKILTIFKATFTKTSVEKAKEKCFFSSMFNLGSLTAISVQFKKTSSIKHFSVWIIWVSQQSNLLKPLQDQSLACSLLCCQTEAKLFFKQDYENPKIWMSLLSNLMICYSTCPTGAFLPVIQFLYCIIIHTKRSGVFGE